MTRNSDGAVHKVPEDLKSAIAKNSKAMKTWAETTPLAKNEWACWVLSTKQEETRKRRVKVGVSKLASGMRRPCCWAGCPHR